MQIEGLYFKTIYRNNSNGFTLFSLKLPVHDAQGRKLYFCRGIIPNYAEGTPLLLEGDFKQYKKEEFVVENSAINVKTGQMMLSFLIAHLSSGMGNVCAERVFSLINAQGLAIEDFLKKESAVKEIAEIKGFTPKKAVAYVNRLSESLYELNLLTKLAPFGITYKQVKKLYELHGSQTSKLIKENPYKHMRKTPIPFSCIDAYAKSLGFSFCDSNRITELVARTYWGLAATGHCYSDYKYLLNLFRYIEQQYSCFDEIIPDALILLELFRNKAGFVDTSKGDVRFYTKDSEDAENKIVSNLARLKRNKKVLVTKEKICEYLEKDGNFLDESQKDAFRLLEDTQTSFLIGGPGTGKTTTIKNIVECYKRNIPDGRIALCAPTGRAAERMKEATGVEASTIHLLLEYTILNGESFPQRNEQNPLDIDFLIIDEFSMVGIYLFSELLAALPDTTKILIVGDWNQLQSIEPGFLLHDLVNSNCFPYKKLEKTHRQTGDNSIIENSFKILAGDDNLICDKNTEISNFVNNAEIRARLKELFMEYHNDDDYQDFMVITPVRKGDAGVEGINQLAQELFHDNTEPYIAVGNNIFYENDKIMTIRNRYDSECSYFNGDIWRIKGILDYNRMTICSEDDYYIDIEDEYLDDISLAYAMTIHKCQGSEAKTVVIVLPDNIPQKMIQKSLLYTGATRPKDKLIILYASDMLTRFIHSDIHEKRYTGILDKIKNSSLANN